MDVKNHSYFFERDDNLTAIKSRNLPAGWHKAFYTLWLGCFITGMGFSMTMPFISLFISDLGNYSKLQINLYSGLAFAMTFIAQAIVSPYWGSLADRKGRKLMCMRASGVMAITITLTGFAPNAIYIVIMRFIQGSFSGYINNATALMGGLIGFKAVQNICLISCITADVIHIIYFSILVKMAAFVLSILPVLRHHHIL